MKRVQILDKEKARLFFGQFDQHIRQLEKDLGVTIAGRGSEIIIKGARNRVISAQAAIEARLAKMRENRETGFITLAGEAESADGEIAIGSRKQKITPRTPGQRRYADAVRAKDVVVAIGPAGTGKTYLAVALAIEHLRRNKVERVIISRPAIEAGEKLGFLPGDLEEKIKPYLQPIYDALYDLVWPEDIRRLMDHRVIEILPLAYMRGRTLSDAFILLDEAQNATPEQMKMFLTRMGVGSRMVITGDTTQSDLPSDQTSGLRDIEGFLKNIAGISFVYLDQDDVVRHPLVREIILAYERKRTGPPVAVPPEPAAESAAGRRRPAGKPRKGPRRIGPDLPPAGRDPGQ